jgi:DNA-binding MarR family transcriptional regulator
MVDMSSIYQPSNNQNISTELKYVISLNQMQSVVSRKFDHMGSMVGFTDFIVLYHLSNAEGQKLRRVDLADKVGVTASGVTRILLPMEKIGLVGREANPRDARVSIATLTKSGQRVLDETLERAEIIAADIIPLRAKDDINTLIDISEEIRRSAL